MEDLNSVGDSYVIKAGVGVNASEGATVHGRYDLVCRDAKGNIKWTESTDNVVVDTGKKYLLDAITTSTTAVGPYLGLITSGSPTTTSTLATIAATEAAASVFANRLTPSFSAASGSGTVSKAATAVTFTAGGAGATVTGCFLVCGTGATNVPVTGTTGTLYSAGNFTSKTLAATDTLQVTYTTTLA